MSSCTDLRLRKYSDSWNRACKVCGGPLTVTMSLPLELTYAWVAIGRPCNVVGFEDGEESCG